MYEAKSRDPNLALGGIVLAFFGGAWILSWNFLFNERRLVVNFLVLAVGLCIAGASRFVFVRRTRLFGSNYPTDRPLETSRRLRTINVAQWIAIAAAIVILNVFGLPSYIPYVIIGIVGIHFLPLASALGCKEYRLTGAALVVVAAATVILAWHGAAASWGILATGLILWATAVALLRGL